MSIYSLSTMWWVGRFNRAADFVSAAQSLGFDKIELNPQVTPEMLQEVLALVDAGKVEISSVHAPCPAWKGPGTVPELSALDEGERVAAVGIIKDAVDLAKRVGASAVVVHSGRVDAGVDQERALRQLFDRGEKGTAAYQRLMRDLIRERAAVRRSHLDATARSLAEVQEYARRIAPDGTVKIGLESRYHYYEVPLVDEMQTLLGSLDPAISCYWHDVGHAHNLEVLGFQAHEEWLKLLGPRMLGIHLHDAVLTADHRPVGTGEIDFRMVMGYVPRQTIRVCEFNSSWPYEAVEAAFRKLKDLRFL